MLTALTNTPQVLNDLTHLRLILVPVKYNWLLLVIQSFSWSFMNANSILLDVL